MLLGLSQNFLQSDGDEDVAASRRMLIALGCSGGGVTGKGHELAQLGAAPGGKSTGSVPQVMEVDRSKPGRLRAFSHSL